MKTIQAAPIQNANTLGLCDIRRIAASGVRHVGATLRALDLDVTQLSMRRTSPRYHEPLQPLVIALEQRPQIFSEHSCSPVRNNQDSQVKSIV
jgi:hypothetical protein